ncbi:MAG: SH3 domain-containing protein [Candidatus Rokubacteria bacterium]|nr:SH3 domain-containing protein [Candidatus Rokubacteria bacterium]
MRRRETWLAVRGFQGRNGWIHALLTDGRSAVVVTARLVNVRSGPGTDRPVVFTAERGVNFLALRARGGWLEVQHEDGDRGWVHGALVWGDK